MGIIAVLPGLAAAYVAWRHSLALAFLNIYLPVLLLAPEYYRWIVPVLPDPTCSQATIIPIALLFLIRESGAWRFSLTDFLMFGLAFCIGYSEYRAAGYKEAQNLMFDMIASFLLPYIAAKGLIEPKGLRVAFARRFVILLFGISIISVFEFRFGMTPWQIVLNRLFPGQGDGWITTFRYGFARIAGPYGHAILAGLILVIGFRIQRWLEWSGYWAPRFRNLPWLKISKARLITLGLTGGLAMTLVRGPWLGGIIGAVFTAAGLAVNRKRALLLIAAGAIVVGIPAVTAFLAYASVGRAAAGSDSQETAAYRYELVQKYVDIAIEKSMFGWGRNTWPKVPGMPSIDNYYLLLALMHGLIAESFLIAILLLMTIRLIRFDLRRPSTGKRGSSLGFTLAGIYVAFSITIATVYVGLSVLPVFAVITGWAEGYLLNRFDSTMVVGVQTSIVRAGRFRFQRVLA